jgi:hypothetical protein
LSSFCHSVDFLSPLMEIIVYLLLLPPPFTSSTRSRHCLLTVTYTLCILQ